MNIVSLLGLQCPCVHVLPSLLYFFTAFVILHFAELAVDGCWAIAWFFYLGFVTVLTAVRIQCRERFFINGNAFEDFFASLFFYPNVALQLDESTKNIGLTHVKKTDMKMKDAENGRVEKSDMKMQDAENGRVNAAFEN